MSNRESSSKSGFLRWGITFAVGLVIVVAFAFYRGVLNVEGAARVWRILCDGCFFAAVLLIGVGLMTLVSAEGTFDIVSYGMMRLNSVLRKEDKKGKRLPGGEAGEENDHPSFYDYKMAKRGTRSTHWYLVFVGLIFLAGAFLCMVMFHRAGGIPLA